MATGVEREGIQDRQERIPERQIPQRQKISVAVASIGCDLSKIVDPVGSLQVSPAGKGHKAVQVDHGPATPQKCVVVSVGENAVSYNLPAAVDSEGWGV